MPILQHIRVLMFGLIALGSLGAGCSQDDVPGDGTPGYWDQAEVDAACESYGSASTMCEETEVGAQEVADSCAESVMVDNVNDDADCYQAQVDRYACIGGLTCEQLPAYVDQAGDYPCKAEEEAFAQSC